MVITLMVALREWDRHVTALGGMRVASRSRVQALGTLLPPRQAMLGCLLFARWRIDPLPPPPGRSTQFLSSACFTTRDVESYWSKVRSPIHRIGTRHQGIKAASTGMSPFAPHCWMTMPPLALLYTYQTPIEGRKTETSIFPSPSKSAGAGASPFCPQYTSP